MLPLRDRLKGSDLDTNQKQLTMNDKRLQYTASDDTTVQLETYQQIVTITNDAAFTLVLPSVAEATGKKFEISVKSTGQDVTLTDSPNESFSDSVSWGGDYILNTADESITLRSDGRSWIVVSNDIA